MLRGLFPSTRPSRTKRPPVAEVRRPAGRWQLSGANNPRRKLRIARVVRETANASTLVLEPLGGELLTYRAGQYLTLLVEVGGVGYRRAYSFSSSPAEALPAAITIKRVPGGIVSNYVNDHLASGDVVEVLGPNGAFVLPDGDDAHAPRDYVFIAGGSGITPLMSLARTILATEPASRVLLLYGNRCRDEIIFRRELEELTGGDDRLRVAHYLEDATGMCDAKTGLLTGEAILGAAGRIDDRWFYVCGPEAMMDGAEHALLEAGVARDCIRLERFTFAARPTELRPQRGYPVRFLDHDAVVEARAGQTLLEAGLAAGLPLAFSCTMGGCGSCKLRVRSGSVVMDEPNCLSPSEREEGCVLACVAYAAEEVAVGG